MLFWVRCSFRFKLLLFILSSLSLFPSSSQAWWNHGHEVIGQVADSLLTEKARARIDRLQNIPIEGIGPPHLVSHTNTMRTVGVWADYILEDPYKASTLANDPFGPECHFILVLVDTFQIQNLRDSSELRRDLVDFQVQYFKGRERLEKGEGKNSVSCTLKAIQTLTSLDAKVSDRNRAIALRYLVHLIGDMHQPLHNFSIYYDNRENMNRGSTRLSIPQLLVPGFKAKVSDQDTNWIFSRGEVPVIKLHSLWDAAVGAFTQLPKLDYKEPRGLEATDLPQLRDQVLEDAQLLLNKSTQLKETILQERPDLIHWIAEGIGVGLNSAYGNLNLNAEGFPFATDQIDSYYQGKNIPVVRKQLATAGYRLGALLNAIFDPDQAPPLFSEWVNTIAPIASAKGSRKSSQLGE